MTGFLIGSRPIGDGAPCLIVAEVGLAHDGSVRIAHDFIEAIVKAGADAAKFQCHVGDDTNEWRVPPDEFSPDDDRQAYWRRTGFTEEDWRGLRLHCMDAGLIFLCSPFSVEAVKLLDPLVPAWKVPSGEIGNVSLLEALARTGKPIILSTGMATEDEIGSAEEGAPWMLGPRYAVLQCTSEYPTKPEHIGLDYLETLRERFYPNPVGLSDHSGTIWPSLAAVTLGASIVEVHVKLSAHDSGFDASSSITIEELAQLVQGVRFIEKAKQPVDKNALARELEPMRRVFMHA